MKNPFPSGCSKIARCKAHEERAAERTLYVREQREPKRNAADGRFVKPSGFFRQGRCSIIIAPPLRECAPGQQPEARG